MNTPIHRAEDPTLETIEPGAIYRVHSPRTGDPCTLYKVAYDCGVDSIGPLDVPDGWDDTFEYARGDHRIWNRIIRLAMDADLAHAVLEVALVPVDDEETTADSCALLCRLDWPY